MAGDSPSRVNILGISGSLRTHSYNTALLRLAARVAGHGAELTLWHGLGEIPPFNEDDEEHPDPSVTRMRSTVAAADAVLIATPEYNTTVPGQLKTLLDWASRPTHRGVFADRPTAVISASLTPYGARWAQDTVRGILGACGSHLIGDPLSVPHADTAFDATGQLYDREAQARLAGILRALADAVRSRACSASPIS